MNVFDDEVEMLGQQEALRLSTLVAAGLTREELTAYERMVRRGILPN